MDWKSLAIDLPTGHRTRANCDCGDGKTLVINNNLKGYSCFCFRCDFKDFVPVGKQTLKELEQLRKLNDVAKSLKLKVELPEDFTNDIPLTGRLWLYKGGITESIWKLYNIGYSEELQRVILPVYDKEDKLIWFQARAIHKGQEPKYIQPSAAKEQIMFRSKETVEGTSAVILEDILSAIRVGKFTTAISLLGTKITTEQAAQLSGFSKVTTWLDGDKAGIKGSYNIRRTLDLVTEVSNIFTNKDPKLLSNEEIKLHLRC